MLYELKFIDLCKNCNDTVYVWRTSLSFAQEEILTIHGPKRPLRVGNLRLAIWSVFQHFWDVICGSKFIKFEQISKNDAPKLSGACAWLLENAKNLKNTLSVWTLERVLSEILENLFFGFKKMIKKYLWK